MKKYYILILYPVFALFAISNLHGQDINCPSIDCGNLNVNFNNEGEVIFCEGSTITLLNESAPGFDFFIIEWGDGVIDTIFNYDNPQHQYDIPDSLICETPQTSFDVSFTGIAICDAGNSCQSGSYNFGIKPEPLAAFGVDNTICVDTDFSPGDASCHALEYEWNFGDGTISNDPAPVHQYDTPGTYTISQTVTNTCGSDMTTREITVVGESEASFDQGITNGCANTPIDFIAMSNQYTTTVWTISPFGEENWCFTDTLMTLASDSISVIFKRPDVYTITLGGFNVCGQVEESGMITIEEAPVVSLSPAAAACDQITLTVDDLNFDITGSYQSIGWEFVNGSPSSGTGEDPGSVTFTETGMVNLTVVGDCGTLNQSVDVIVNQNVAININTPPDYCSGSSPDTLIASPPEGTWSGTGVSSDGVFDPSIGPGMYPITYRLNNAPCNDEEQITITVQASETVTVNDQLFCEDSPADTLFANPSGGTWTGMGITNPDVGIFDPADSGTGPFNPVYTFTDGNGCEVTASPTVTVEELPELTIPDSITLCLSDEDIDLSSVTSITADPGGGAFEWAGDGVINANGTFNSSTTGLGPGMYTLMVTYSRNECVVSDDFTVILTADEPLTIDPVMPLCITDNTYQLNANLSGGTWSGPGVDPSSGEIDLPDAGGGPATYTYVYAAGTSCEQTGSVDVEIIDLGAQVSAGETQPVCEGPATITLDGASPADGTWTGPGILNATLGTVDLQQLTPGQSYNYEYCIESDQVANCSACATKTLIYNPKPEAGFSFDGMPCINTTFTLIPDQTGLNYEWDFGDNTTSIDENPTHTYLTSDTYTLTQIVTTNENCADTTSQELYITTPPTADFTLLDDEGCAPFTLELENNSFGDDITQQWCINGDTIPGETPPAYILDSLTDDTIFPIVLKVTNLCGTTMDSASALVHPYPLVNFGISEDEGCSPFRPEVNNITLGNPDSFLWRLGPDSTSTEFEPILPEFTTPDDSVSVYTIQLLAENECGMDSLSKEVTIYPPDVEAFIELDTLSGCQPFTVYPQSFSTPGSELSWEVIGPNGQVTGGSGNQPELILPDPGIYTIILFAARCGMDSDTAQIEVLPAPEVGFNHDDAICLGDSINFQNTSINVGNSSWDFGDGNSSNAFSPTHVFDSAGIFTITYIGQSLVNNCPGTVTSEIEVYGLPESSFSPPVSASCPPLLIGFQNQSTGTGNLSYIWDFGDGSNPSLEENPFHSFTEPGNYEVKLIAFDDLGCFSDTSEAIVTIHPVPISAFTLSQNEYCLGHDTIQALNQSTDAASSEWVIGGIEFQESNPSLFPDMPGLFSASLLVTNNFGCQDSSVQAYAVLPSPIAAFMPIPEAICANGLINFQNQSTFSDQYLWDFGTGVGSTETDPGFSYETEGTYVVSLTASSSNGCPDSLITNSVTIHPNPIASFTLERPFVCGTPLEAIFTNTSVGNLQNDWTFGDGGTSMSLHPTHIYEAAGTHEINLITTTDFGCKDTTSQIIDVYGQPVAVASASAQRVCAGTEVFLTAEPTDAIHYEWYILPSLQPDTGQQVSYELDQAGDYDIRLIAIYNTECRDTLEWPNAISVFNQPIADFDFVADELENIIGDVRFINDSENATDYFWDLGDGNTSTDFEPEHEYDINRDVLVQLIASTTNDGLFFCADTLVKVIEPEWITSFEVPNAMSPDFGDPAVQEFGAVGSGVEAYILKVYSPYGALLWSTDELDEGHPSGRWQGFYQNKRVPQGAYSWEAEVKFVNGVEIRKKGTVTVLR